MLTNITIERVFYKVQFCHRFTIKIRFDVQRPGLSNLDACILVWIKL